MAGFPYDADLGRLGLKLHTARHQLSHSRCRMLDTELLDHTLTGPAQRHIMKRLGPIDTHSKQMSCLPLDFQLHQPVLEALRRADRPVLTGTTPS